MGVLESAYFPVICGEVGARSNSCAGAHCTNDFSCTIHIWLKFHFTLSQILINWSLQNFAHDTTAVLSWHVQKFVVIWWPVIEIFSIKFELLMNRLLVKWTHVPQPLWSGIGPGHYLAVMQMSKRTIVSPAQCNRPLLLNRNPQNWCDPPMKDSICHHLKAVVLKRMAVVSSWSMTFWWVMNYFKELWICLNVVYNKLT